MSEPTIRVGLVEGAASVRLQLEGRFVAGADPLPAGEYEVTRDGARVALRGSVQARGDMLRLSPADFETGRLTVHDVTIGKDFHWQRQQSQVLQGALECRADWAGLTVINELPLESYLASVISSEMRASCPAALLRAHAIVSRSWLLAQLANPPREEEEEEASNAEPESNTALQSPPPAWGGKGWGANDQRGVDDQKVDDQNPTEISRWYDRESHQGFDVCADDHCQRYQGISRAFTPAVFEAVRATRGVALVQGDQVCDARYSKCCGGMTEVFSTAWEDRDVPYLRTLYDGPGAPAGFALPCEGPSSAERWILGAPAAYCSHTDPAFLAQVLPGFDQETPDFYRWVVTYAQDELGAILQARLGRDLGRIAALEALRRGPSGRISRLLIRGERGSVVVGKELEVRRTLSRAHLYSSAFVPRGEDPDAEGFPRRFRLTGAGWGHGVGLCQIGAAALAVGGASHEGILDHYFRGASPRRLYDV